MKNTGMIRNAFRYMRDKMRRKNKPVKFTMKPKMPDDMQVHKPSRKQLRKQVPTMTRIANFAMGRTQRGNDKHRGHRGKGKHGSEAVSTPRKVKHVMLPLHHVRQSGMAGKINLRNAQ